MKRVILLAIFIGMIGWSINEYILSSKESAQNDQHQFYSKDSKGTDEELEEAEVGFNQGDIAPDFELTTLSGEEVKLSDFRGERVMLNFWATWCPPCRAEMPDMQTLYEKNDVTILAVNLLETEENLLEEITGVEKVEQFVDDFGLTFPILLDEKSEVANMYQIQPIPSSFMIDSKGRIQNVVFGALNYELMLQVFEMIE